MTGDDCNQPPDGVAVHMFDRELQEIIRSENKEFFEQAQERAAAANENEKPKTITLSTLENTVAAEVNDFSTDALEQYRSITQIKDELDSPEFRRRLLKQGLLKEEKGQLTPTGFGLLLFGEEPRTVMPQAALLATIYYHEGGEELQTFDGPLVLIPSLVEKWLSDKLPNIIDRSNMRRRGVVQVPFEMIREAVVNALIHRDYEIRQCKCQLVISADTIAIKSPGGPLPPITLAQLRSFNAPMLSRNPELHYVFAKMEMAEERGLGIRSLKTLSQQIGLPLPKYTWDDPYLVLTIFRSQEAATGTLAPDVLDSLSGAEQNGWQWMRGEGTANASQYAEAMQLDSRTARRHLNHFVRLGLATKTGAGPSTKYEII